jgi:hypothetical protein
MGFAIVARREPRARAAKQRLAGQDVEFDNNLLWTSN